MSRSEETVGRGLLVRWIALARRGALAVCLLAVAAAAGGLAYSVGNLGINTSTADMLSEELPFRRNFTALEEALPKNVDLLLIVVEAGTPELAEEAAEALAARLAAQTDRFHSIFYPASHPFFRRNGLLYLDLEDLEALSDRLAEAQPMLASLNEDPSLRGLSGVLRLAITESQGEMDAAVAPVLAAFAETVERVAEGRPARLSWRELMTGDSGANGEAGDGPGDGSGDGTGLESRRQLIVSQPVLDFGSLEIAGQARDAITAAARDLGLTEDKGVSVRVTGSPALLDDELTSVRDGMGLVGLLSLVFVLVLLAIGLQSWRLVLATLVTLLIGLIWTATFATLAIGELNLISVAFAVLFIGLSVDFGIHFTLRYREAIDGGSGHDKALALAGGGVGRALTLSAVAAAIGFLSFLPTTYRGVSELGLISGAGMFIALFANLTVLPALLTLMPLTPGKPLNGGREGLGLQGVVRRHGRSILIAAALLGLAAAASLPYARFDDDPMNLRDPQSESVATLFDLMDAPRVDPYDAQVLAADLATAADLAARLTALPEVESATTAYDLVPGGQDDKLAVIDEMTFFLTPLLLPVAVLPPPGPEEQQRALDELRTTLAAAGGGLAADAQRLAAALARIEPTAENLAALEDALLGGLAKRLDFLAEALEAGPVALDDLPAALRDRRIAADGRAAIEMIPAEDLRDAEARRRFVAAVQQVAPGATGAPIIVTAAGEAVIQSFREAAVWAIALIALLLLAVLRNLRDTLMVLAPLALSALITVAATVVLRQPFNFANVIVLPLLFGLGVAFGIQLVLRGRAEGADKLMQSSTARAVIFSALTTIGSFCALALSSHPGTASMGLLLTLAITVTMVCTLIVLPALLNGLARGTPPQSRP